MITFAAVVAVTLYYAQRTFQTSIDDSLQGAAQTVDSRLQDANQDPDHQQKVIDDLGTASQFIALLDPEGHITNRSSSTPNSFQSQGGRHLRGKLNDATQFHTVKAGKSKLRTIRYPLIRGDQSTGYVMVASPIPEVDDAIQSLAVLVIIAGLLGMSVAVIGTVWLSIREARPLKELTEDVRTTAASGFELAVPRSREGSLEARELREAFAKLVEKEREVITRERAFFADSSHVLRTPLAVFQGDIEQLEQGVYGKERLEVVAQARHSLGTMSRAVNGLLLLAREQEASPGSTWEVVELARMIERLVAEATVAALTLTVGARIITSARCRGRPTPAERPPRQPHRERLSLHSRRRRRSRSAFIRMRTMRSSKSATPASVCPSTTPPRATERFYRGAGSAPHVPGGLRPRPRHRRTHRPPARRRTQAPAQRRAVPSPGSPPFSLLSACFWRTRLQAAVGRRDHLQLSHRRLGRLLREVLVLHLPRVVQRVEGGVPEEERHGRFSPRLPALRVVVAQCRDGSLAIRAQPVRRRASLRRSLHPDVLREVAPSRRGRCGPDLVTVTASATGPLPHHGRDARGDIVEEAPCCREQREAALELVVRHRPLLERGCDERDPPEIGRTRANVVFDDVQRRRPHRIRVRPRPGARPRGTSAGTSLALDRVLGRLRARLQPGQSMAKAAVFFPFGPR